MAYDGSLIFDTKIDNKGFEKGVSGLKSAGAKAGKVIATGIAAASTAIVAFGGFALKSSIDFESAFADVKKVLDGTDKQFAGLEQGIRDMSKRLPQSATEIAGVAAAAGQLGIKTADILGFTETMVMLGDTTNLSSEEAATSLARLAAITGMSHKDFDRLGSTIVDLGNNFATTESEIVEMGLRLAGTGNQVGLSEDQILGLAAAMSSVGINAEAGGSSMSRVMQKINTEVLSGGDNLEKFAKVSGMSADEFSKKWKEEPEQAIVSFVDGLGKIKESGGDVTTALKEMGINSMQELDTLLRLSGASDTLSEALGISAEAWEENTALLDEAEQRYATTEAKIAILKNNITDLAITVGNELKTSLLDVIDTSVDMIDRLSTAFEEGGFGGLVEELGSVLADVLTMLAEAAPQLMESATNMIMAFLTGIRENLPQISEAAIEMIQGFIESALTILPEMLVLGIELIANLMQGIGEMLPELIPVGTEAIDTILDALMDNLPLIIDAGIDIIAALVDGISDSLPKLMTMAIDLIIMVADKIIENLPKIIESGLKLLTSLVKGIMDNLPKLIAEVPRIINAFADAIYSALPTILKAGVGILLEIIKGLINTIPTLVANIPAIIMAIVNVFTLYNWWNLGKNVITKLGTGISSMVSNIGTIARDLASNTIQAIKNIFTGAPAVGSGFIKGIMSGISSLASSLISLGSTMAGNALTAIKTAFSNAPSIGSDMVKGIWNGISNVTGWILNKIQGFGSSIMNGIKGIFGIKSPSTVMRDEIGKNLILGMGVGIEKEIPKLQRDIDREMGALTAKMKSTVEFETSNNARVMTGNSGYGRGNEVITNNNDNGITQNVTIVSPENTPSENARQLKKAGRDLALGY